MQLSGNHGFERRQSIFSDIFEATGAKVGLIILLSMPHLMKVQPAARPRIAARGNRRDRLTAVSHSCCILRRRQARLVPSRRRASLPLVKGQRSYVQRLLNTVSSGRGPSPGRGTASRSLPRSLGAHRPSIIGKSLPTNIDAGTGPSLGQEVLRSRQFDIGCRSTTPLARSVYLALLAPLRSRKQA